MKISLPRLIVPRSKGESRVNWQECGLATGYILGRHFLGLEDLHYGYWAKGLDPTAANLKTAQDNYSQFLISHIPRDARHILDVGAGGGALAARLMERGHRVDCVSPSRFLSTKIRERLGERASVFECRFEDLKPKETYNAVVFSESFQYIPFANALVQSSLHLRPGGSVVICDFFSKDIVTHSPIRGGHPLGQFREALTSYPFQVVKDIDITAETAPTIKVANDSFTNAIQPIWIELWRTLHITHPHWSKLARRFFKRRIDKFERKYFSGLRTPEAFIEHKEYRFIHLLLT